MAALPSRKPRAGPSPKGKPDDPTKCWLHEGHCCYCDSTQHTRRVFQKYKELLAKSGGRKPAGFEGALNKRGRPTEKVTATGRLEDPEEIFRAANDLAIAELRSLKHLRR